MTVAEWCDMSKYQARRILPLVGNWTPSNWDTSAIDFDKLVAEAEVVVIRLGDGMNLDPCFVRYREALVTRRALWAIYHLHRPEVAAGRQEAFVKQHQPEMPPAGVWGDFEFNNGLTGETYFNNANRYLLGLDNLYDTPTGMYSGAWFLNPILTQAQMARWAWRKSWFASYPNLSIPSGWRDAPRQYVLHQYTDRRVWPGLPRPADANWRNPAVPLSALLFVTPPPPPPADTLAADIAGHARAVLGLVD